MSGMAAGGPGRWRRPTIRGAGGARRTGFLVVAVASLGVLAGCGGSSSASSGAAGATTAKTPEVNAAGDIPDSQVFVPVSPAGGDFTVSVPQGWARSTAGSATVFTDKFNSVRLVEKPAQAAPTAATVQASEVPALKAATPGFALGNVTTVQRPAGQAVRVTYDATSPPSPVTGKTVTESVERYEFWRSGHEVVITLSGPKGADNVDPWRKITDSFRWR